MPGVLGRVCPHPCEDKCRRQELDEPVAICDLKRFAADQVDLGSYQPAPGGGQGRENRHYRFRPGRLDLRLSAWPCKGYRPTIFEALSQAGGMLRVGIPDYRLPKDVLDREIDNILRLGVELKTNTALGRDFTLDDLFEQGYQGRIPGHRLSCGQASGNPRRGCRRGHAGSRVPAASQSGQEPLTVGKRMAVIGGGNVAFDVARTARRLGPSVTIVYRRSREEMPANRRGNRAGPVRRDKNSLPGGPPESVRAKDGKVAGLHVPADGVGRSRTPPGAAGRYP